MAPPVILTAREEKLIRALLPPGTAITHQMVGAVRVFSVEMLRGAAAEIRDRARGYRQESRDTRARVLDEAADLIDPDTDVQTTVTVSPELGAFATEPAPRCAHCGREVEEKIDPDMGGNHHRWWVHYPGGYTPCHPQLGGRSTKAEPMATRRDATGE